MAKCLSETSANCGLKGGAVGSHLLLTRCEHLGVVFVLMILSDFGIQKIFYFFSHFSFFRVYLQNKFFKVTFGSPAKCKESIHI